jgi:tetratricopeptide (TPR) repeat protein
VRPDTRGQLAVTVAAVLVLGALSVWLQAARDRVPLAQSDEVTIYLSQRAAGRVVFVHRSLAADLYWIRALQFFGGQTRTAKARQTEPFAPPPMLAAERTVSFDLLYPMLDIATTLDPRFNIAYRFGAIFLSEAYPAGPGRPDQAVALLEKGLKASPERWQYWQDIGFVYYWNVHDYGKASEAFRRGADLAGAPWWMRSLAATMLVKGGDRNTSRLLWRQLYETANNEYARVAALNKLSQLKAIEDIEQLQAALDRGVLRGLPRDPAGFPYIINNGRVDLSRDSTLFPLPIEPDIRPAR